MKKEIIIKLILVVFNEFKPQFLVKNVKSPKKENVPCFFNKMRMLFISLISLNPVQIIAYNWLPELNSAQNVGGYKRAAQYWKSGCLRSKYGRRYGPKPDS